MESLEPNSINVDLDSSKLKGKTFVTANLENILFDNYVNIKQDLDSGFEIKSRIKVTTL